MCSCEMLKLVVFSEVSSRVQLFQLMMCSCEMLLFFIACSVSASKAQEPSIGDAFKMQIAAPNKTGSFPVVFFVTGFSADAPTSLYSDLISRIVMKDFIVVGLDHLRVPNYPQEGSSFHDVLEWARAGHLVTEMKSKGFPAVPDVNNRAAVMGQSSGNHVVGQALTDGCSIAKAFVMIDPVDGYDPFGVVKSQSLIHPGKKLNFSVPSLLLDNGLDPKAVLPVFPACAPASLSNDLLFNAMVGPIWNINSTAYGHVDCLNDNFATKISHLICPSDSHTDKTLYRGTLAEATTMFLSSLF